MLGANVLRESLLFGFALLRFRMVRCRGFGAGQGSSGAQRFAMRKSLFSGSAFEAEVGYARAVVDDPWVFVSGTTGFDYVAMTIADDAATQAEQCIENICMALDEAGSALEDVVRVRYIVPTIDDFNACKPVLRKHFGDIGPAATMFCAGLFDPRMKIEIEVTAKKPPRERQ